MSKLDELKKLATERVRSHGAFGESESYDEINIDKLVKLVVLECAEIAYRASDRNTVSRAILYEFNIDNTRSQMTDEKTKIIAACLKICKEYEEDQKRRRLATTDFAYKNELAGAESAARYITKKIATEIGVDL
jgi:hypothetical protein